MAGTMEDMVKEVGMTNRGTTGVANRGSQEDPAVLVAMMMIRVAMVARKAGPKVRDLTPWLEQLLGMILRR